MEDPPAFDELPVDWWWRATCPPCLDYRHDECHGKDPARTPLICVCDIDRCVPLEEDP